MKQLLTITVSFVCDIKNLSIPYLQHLVYIVKIIIWKEIGSKIYTEVINGDRFGVQILDRDEDQALNPRSRELQGLAGMVGQACIAASSISPI